MKQKLLLLSAAVGSGLTFTALTLLVREDVFKQLDFSVMVKLQNKVPVALSPFLSIFSTLSRFETMMILVIALVITMRSWASIVGLVSFFTMHVIGLFGKLFLDHPAPPFRFYRGEGGFSFPSEYIHYEASYPSGHSMRVVFFAVLAGWLIICARISAVYKGLLLFSLTAITGATLVGRVILGEHWPSDVMGGVFWGLTLAFFTLVFDKRTVKAK